MKAVGSNIQQVEPALLKQMLEAAGEGIVLVRSDNIIGYINKISTVFQPEGYVCR